MATDPWAIALSLSNFGRPTLSLPEKISQFFCLIASMGSDQDSLPHPLFGPGVGHTHCVVTCVVTARSLPVSRVFARCCSHISEGQRTCVNVHEHCPFGVTHVLWVSLVYNSPSELTRKRSMVRIHSGLPFISLNLLGCWRQLVQALVRQPVLYVEYGVGGFESCVFSSPFFLDECYRGCFTN